MISQLIYTSAPSGLSPGSSGYCTVQSSRGIPAPTVDLLESLSGYRHLFTPGSPEAKRNPVNYGHYILRISGKKEHVLSRVSDCDLDHTGRSNKLAHHMIVGDNSSVKGGPAWLLQQPGWMVNQWDGEVKLIDAAPALPTKPRPVSKCTTWETVCGDAGWAGVMAQAFLDDPQRKVFLVYQPGTDVLALFEEAISLLPENRRWDVTFSTYAAALPSTVDCLWTGITADSQEVHLSKRFVNALRIELPTSLGTAPSNSLVDVARTGKVSSKPVAPPAPPKEKTAVSPVIEEPKLEADTYQIADPPPISSTTPNLPPSIPLKKKPKKQSSLKRYLVLLTLLCFIAGGGAYAYINNQNANKALLLAELDKEQSPEISEEDSFVITPEVSAVEPFQKDVPGTNTEETEMEQESEYDSAPHKKPEKTEALPPEKPDPIPAVVKPEKRNVSVEYITELPPLGKVQEVTLKYRKDWHVELEGYESMEILFPVLNAGAKNDFFSQKISIESNELVRVKRSFPNDNGVLPKATEYQCHESIIYKDQKEIFSVKVLINEGDSGIVIRTKALNDLDDGLRPILQHIALLVKGQKQSKLLSTSQYLKYDSLGLTKDKKSFTTNQQEPAYLSMITDKFKITHTLAPILTSGDQHINYLFNSENNLYFPENRDIKSGSMKYNFETRLIAKSGVDASYSKFSLMNYDSQGEITSMQKELVDINFEFVSLQPELNDIKSKLRDTVLGGTLRNIFTNGNTDILENQMKLTTAINKIRNELNGLYGLRIKEINENNNLNGEKKKMLKQKAKEKVDERISVLDRRVELATSRIENTAKQNEFNDRRLTGITLSYEVGPLTGEEGRHRIDFIRVDDTSSE